MADVIIGSAFKLALGLNFDSHLRKIESKVNGNSMNELLVSKLAFAGMKYHDG